MTGSGQIVVNGIAHELAVQPDRSLLEALREELGLTGAKPGCGEGACGACTVLLDGEPVRSCQVRVADALAGRAIGTIEGLASGGPARTRSSRPSSRSAPSSAATARRA